MHYVDCGQPPASLKGIEKFNSAGKPVWEFKSEEEKEKYSNFMHDLSRKFKSICAYCERPCVPQGRGGSKNEVEHFRPREHFGERMFQWENLMYACKRCNDRKENQFPGKTVSAFEAVIQFDASRDEKTYIPPSEYVNPRDGVNKAETFFVFKPSGEISPNPQLDSPEWSKARLTIADLDLNTPGETIRGRQLCTLRQEWLFMTYLAYKLSKQEFKIRLRRSSAFSSLVAYAHKEKWFDNPPEELAQNLQTQFQAHADELGDTLAN